MHRSTCTHTANLPLAFYWHAERALFYKNIQLFKSQHIELKVYEYRYVWVSDSYDLQIVMSHLINVYALLVSKYNNGCSCKFSNYPKINYVIYYLALDSKIRYILYKVQCITAPIFLRKLVCAWYPSKQLPIQSRISQPVGDCLHLLPN